MSLPHECWWERKHGRRCPLCRPTTKETSEVARKLAAEHVVVADGEVLA